MEHKISSVYFSPPVVTPTPGPGGGYANLELYERLEHGLLFVMWDTGAVVLDVDRNCFLRHRARKPDASALGREFHGVGEKVDHDLAELIRIGMGVDAARWIIAPILQ